jgi:RNA polymerase primary sigma factor
MKAVDKFQYRAAQVLDLRDLVDTPGHRSLDRRPGRTIRIPVHMIETINKLSRISRQMLQEMGREPTPDGARGAHRAGQGAQGAQDRQGPSPWRRRLAMMITWAISSRHFGHLADDQATNESLKETTHSVLAQLRRARQVLRMRFGIDRYRPTLEEVGKQFDVARAHPADRGQALRKLRHRAAASSCAVSSWTTEPVRMAISAGGNCRGGGGE